MKTFYVCIGNSDDKLTQKRWSEFAGTVANAIQSLAHQVHGVWQSACTSEWQNMCFCFEIDREHEDELKRLLGAFCRRFDQDSISMAEAQTEFITGHTAACGHASVQVVGG